MKTLVFFAPQAIKEQRTDNPSFARMSFVSMRPWHPSKKSGSRQPQSCQIRSHSSLKKDIVKIEKPIQRHSRHAAARKTAAEFFGPTEPQPTAKEPRDPVMIANIIPIVTIEISPEASAHHHANTLFAIITWITGVLSLWVVVRLARKLGCSLRAAACASVL